MTYARREFLKGAGAGLLTFTVGGCAVQMSPTQARARRVPLSVLSRAEANTLEALGDVLLPGAANAGISHFIDHQLGRPFPEQLLMIRYLGVNPPFAPFYQGGLAGLEAVSRARHGSAFAGLDGERQKALVAELAQGQPKEWSGPPAPFFYFVLRADAIDVVYGTEDGFEELGIPYMAHIRPPSAWGQES